MVYYVIALALYMQSSYREGPALSVGRSDLAVGSVAGDSGRGLDPKSPPVQLLRPQGAASAFYASFPWVSAAGEAVPGLPGANTAWTAQPGAKLTPTAPLVLTYDNGAGLKFTRTISIDANYMFTVADTVANAGATPVSLQAMGVVAQVGTPADFDYSNPAHPHATSSLVHEGGVGVVDGQLKIPSYTCSFGQLFCNAWKKDQPIAQSAVGGWLGITQKYWLAALVPDQKSQIHATYQALATNGPDAFETDVRGPRADDRARRDGDRDQPLLRRRQDRADAAATTARLMRIPRFDHAVDWGISGSSPSRSSPCWNSSISQLAQLRRRHPDADRRHPPGRSSRSPTRATS